MAVPYLEHSHTAGVVLAISVAAFAVGEVAQVLRLRRGVHASDWRHEVVFRLVFFAAVVALPLSYAHLPDAALPGGLALFLGGTLLGWLGLVLRWWCFIVLGRSFTTVIKAESGQAVVDHGPYRVLRHPSYTGILLAFLGCGLMLANWCGLLLALALVLVGLVYRIRFEERALAEALGNAYLDFARGRARLVPFFW